MSIVSEIERLQNAKADIKTAIENKGVSVGNGLIDTYANKINQIETGITPTGNIEITQNGTYDVTDKATATVNVPTSSMGPIIEGEGEYEVRFIDYDGTLLKIQYVEDGESATAPEVPEHEGLVLTGWNNIYTNVTRDVDTGALYKTASDKTEVYFDCNEYSGLNMTMLLTSVASGAITIEFDDGEVRKTSHSASSQIQITKTFSGYGEHWVKLKGTATYYLGYSSYGFIKNDMAGNYFFTALKKLYCSERIVGFTSYAFKWSVLEELAISSPIKQYGTYAFQSCIYLKGCNLPRPATSSVKFQTRMWHDNVSIKYLPLPEAETSSSTTPIMVRLTLDKIVIPYNFYPTTATKLGYLVNECNIEKVVLPKMPTSSTISLSGSWIRDNYTIREIVIPEGVTGSTGNYNLAYNRNLRSLVIPSTFSTISNYLCTGSNALQDIYIYATTPPTMSGTANFVSIPTTCKIHVPAESLEAYKSATNWSSHASKMVGDL